MTRFRSIFTAKVLLAILVLAIGVGIYVASVPKADAIGGLQVCSYYSDATYTHIVGARGNGCCGAVINWGVTSNFKRCQNILCTQQICPN